MGKGSLYSEKAVFTLNISPSRDRMHRMDNLEMAMSLNPFGPGVNQNQKGFHYPGGGCLSLQTAAYTATHKKNGNRQYSVLHTHVTQWANPL